MSDVLFPPWGQRLHKVPAIILDTPVSELKSLREELLDRSYLVEGPYLLSWTNHRWCLWHVGYGRDEDRLSVTRYGLPDKFVRQLIVANDLDPQEVMSSLTYRRRAAS